jgi:branched-chain amino acid transport system substrate-binding protein
MTQSKQRIVLAAMVLITGAAATGASAQETIKLGLSVPLSGAAAIWGKGAEWACKKAAQEIKDSGGVKVKGKAYVFDCVAYDNKYNAAEGTKVAQTLLNRESVNFIVGAIGTAPVQALQSLSERQGAVLFTVAWGKSIKGPKFPLTFTQANTQFEIVPPLVKYVAQTNPSAKTVAILNPNDATGRESEPLARATWEKLGIKVLASDFYERGTTEFQPTAARLAHMKPDIIDLGTTPPADGGVLLKELEVLGWKGPRILEAGTSAETLKATAGAAANGVYLGAGMTFDGPGVSAHQRKLNEEARSVLGDSLNVIQIGSYDAVFAIKAAMEKSQSVAPADVARALPTVKFRSFFDVEAGFGRKAEYGSPQQILLPVIITRIEDGKLVEKAKIAPSAD